MRHKRLVFGGFGLAALAIAAHASTYNKNELRIGLAQLSAICDRVLSSARFCRAPGLSGGLADAHELATQADPAAGPHWAYASLVGADGTAIFRNQFGGESDISGPPSAFISNTLVGTVAIDDDALKFHVTIEQDRTRGNHHTEIIPLVANFSMERFAPYGVPLRYRFRYKAVGFENDAVWEIPVQWHGMRDPAELSRKPPVALYMVDGRYTLVVRSDPRQIALRQQYSREDTFDLGPVVSDSWETWEFNVVWSWRPDGALIVRRNGEIVHEEYDRPNAFNDLLGPGLQMGIYKLLETAVGDDRRAIFDDIEVFWQEVPGSAGGETG